MAGLQDLKRQMDEESYDKDAFSFTKIILKLGTIERVLSRVKVSELRRLRADRSCRTGSVQIHLYFGPLPPLAASLWLALVPTESSRGCCLFGVACNQSLSACIFRTTLRRYVVSVDFSCAPENKTYAPPRG